LVSYIESWELFLGSNDWTDDPYGIFEPIVHDIYVDGTFLYFCSHFKFFVN
jgi:hypothetical protein